MPNLVIKHEFEEVLHASLRKQCLCWSCGLIKQVHSYVVTLDTPLCFVLVFSVSFSSFCSVYFVLPVTEVIVNIVLRDFAIGWNFSKRPIQCTYNGCLFLMGKWRIGCSLFAFSRSASCWSCIFLHVESESLQQHYVDSTNETHLSNLTPFPPRDAPYIISIAHPIYSLQKKISKTCRTWGKFFHCSCAYFKPKISKNDLCYQKFIRLKVLV